MAGPIPTNDPFKMKRGDLRPYMPVSFRKRDGTPFDLSAATAVNIVVKEKDAPDVDPPKFKKPLSPITAETGEFEYRWSDPDTDTSGQFQYEFEITWPVGEPQTIPRDSYYDLIITEDLD